MEFSNSKYKILASYEIIRNDKILNDIYLPIVGKDALCIYNEFSLQINSIFNSFNNTHNYLIKKYNLSKDEFILIRKKLEAIGLMSTYYDELNNEYTYYLRSNLTYKEFMNSNNLRLLLINKIGDVEMRKLQYKYENNFQDINQVNITESLFYLFKDENENELFRFNFTKLYIDLFSKLNIDFKLSFELKKEINDIYSLYSLNYNEILELCLSSFDQETKIIDVIILKTKLDILLNERKKQEIQINTKINRKKELFFSSQKPENYDYIIEDYRKFSSENYLISLTKQKLNNNQINFISKLKLDFNLEDYQINVVLDFAFFKNNGRFIPQYIEAICKDIWQNDIENISDIINKLNSSIIKNNNNLFEKEITRNNINDIDKNNDSDIFNILEIAGVFDNE